MTHPTNHPAAVSQPAAAMAVNAEAVQRLVLRRQAERVTAKLNVPKQGEGTAQRGKED